MDAALAALIGAGVGALVPAAALVIDNRANRADARTSRVFDHRRSAYAEFVKEAGSALDAAVEWYANRDRGDAPDDALSPLYERLVDVKLYGTTAADQAGQRAYEAAVAYVHRADTNENMRTASAALADFIEQARFDLTSAHA